MESTAPNGMEKVIPDSSSMKITTMTTLYVLLLLTGLSSRLVCAQTPMMCSQSASQSCTSYLYFYSTAPQNLSEIAANFGVNQGSDILAPPFSTKNGYMIRKECGCNSSASVGVFFAKASYAYTAADANSKFNLSDIYGGLVYTTPTPPNLQANSLLRLQLLCGCQFGNYSTTITYQVQPTDIDLSPISSSFQSSVLDIQKLNDILDPSDIVPGQVIFVPTDFKPTIAVTTQGMADVIGSYMQMSPDVLGHRIDACAVRDSLGLSDSRHAKTSERWQDFARPSGAHKFSGLVAGVISGVAVLLLLVLVTGCLFWCRRLKNRGVYRRSFVETSGQVSGPVSSASSASRGRSGGSFFSGLLKFHRSPNPDGIKRSITLPKEAMDVFDQEKPVVFYFKEIVDATENFSESRRVGEGAYGAVYSGVLRQQNVAIKQMKMTKSKEFYAELKVLCKVHHTNLVRRIPTKFDDGNEPSIDFSLKGHILGLRSEVELIGYSVGNDSLCLIYEFAENGALNEHLHKKGNKPEEYLPLSWTTRVQIALDTARGLEYIHDHTKDHYVHRDVKTSNILLDGFFRAKVADFGLARLVEQNSQTFASSSRLVGTFGYMAPELSQGDRATSKSDVYAFGVVLFELITGQQAMTRVASGGRRSIISFMLDVLKEEHDPKLRFQNAVDPRLDDCFPLDWSFKMAKLARACVEEEPTHRPDMRTVVFSLSQFLINSVEWEAALAGTSQIFSGLTQGR